MNVCIIIISLFIYSSSLFSMEITALQACKAHIFSTMHTVVQDNHSLLTQLQNNKVLNDKVHIAAINSAREALSYQFNSCIDQAAMVCSNSLLRTLCHNTSILTQTDRATLLGYDSEHAQALHAIMSLNNKIHSARGYLDKAFEKKITSLQRVQTADAAT